MDIFSFLKKQKPKKSEIFYVYDRDPEYDPVKVLFKGTEEQCRRYLALHGHKISW